MSEIPGNQPQPYGSPQDPFPQSYAQPPYAPQRKSGMSATQIVLIVVGVFVALGIIAACAVGVGVWYIAKSAHKDANGQISMNLPFGSIHTIAPDKVAESDFGVPFYPGSRCVTGTRTETTAFSQLSAMFVTPDSGDKVIAFYKEKAGPGAQAVTMPFGATQVTMPAQAGASVTVLITQNKNAFAGETRIQIVRSTPNAAAK
jgi:hypothetical protein